MNHKNISFDDSVATLFSQKEWGGGGGGLRLSYELRYLKFSLSLSSVADVTSLVECVD